MKKIGAPIIVLLLAAVLMEPAQAQEAASLAPITITLNDAIEMALGRNPFHQASLETEAQALARLRQATARFFPSLNATGTHTMKEKLMTLAFAGQTFEVDFTENYQAVFTLAVPLFTGGQLLAGRREARLNVETAREGIRQSEQETVFNVKKAFFGCLLAGEFVDVAREALDLADKHYRNVKNLYEVGMASKFDLLRSEVQAANLRPQLIRARNELVAAELGLKTILNIDLGRGLKVEGKLDFTPVELDVEKAVVESAVNRPELKQADFQVRMSREMFKVARGSMLPNLALSGSFNYWGDRVNFRGWTNYYSVNLVLNIPIFNGLQEEARMSEARALSRQLEWTKKGVAANVELEVRQAHLNYKQARETLLSQGKNIEQAREAVRLAELNFNEGLATNLDVTSAQVALSQARTNYSQAVYDCVVSLAQLEKAVGKDGAARS